MKVAALERDFKDFETGNELSARPLSELTFVKGLIIGAGLERSRFNHARGSIADW